MAKDALNVLFLCTANSARSIMAEAILNREGKGRFKGYSAGSYPSGAINPHAAILLKSLNYNIESAYSKGWEIFSEPDAPQMDFIFTVCDDAAGETCPVWPGHPVSAHWGVPDPAKATGTDAERQLAFANAYRMLERRISIFVNLPLEKTERSALTTRLQEIGKIE